MGVQEVDRHWYISRNGKRYGPYTYAALTEAAAKGVVTGDTNVWRLGWVSWHPAWQVPGLIEEPAPATELAPGGASIVPAQERPEGGADAEAGLPQSQDSGEEHRVPATPSHDAAAGDGAASQVDDGAAQRRMTQDTPEPAPEGSLGDSPRAAGHDESQGDKSEDWPRIAAQDGSKVSPLDLVQGTLRESQADAQPATSETASSDASADKPPGAEPPPPPDQEIATAALRAVGEEAPEHAEQSGDVAVPPVPPQTRNELSGQASSSLSSRQRRGRRGWKAALGGVVLTLMAGIWGLLASGTVIVIVPRLHYRSGEVPASQLPRADDAGERATLSPGEDERSRVVAAANPSYPRKGGIFPVASAPAAVPASPASPASDAAPPEIAESKLPAAVAALPAVVALKSTAPAAFAKFKQRFGEAAANVPDDDILGLARTALRESVKRQLANASAETLVEITEDYLGYMQALQSSNPASCVALSDDTKGANLTVNVAKEFPALFAREMAVLARVAGGDPGTVVTPLTAEQARPSLETVFAALRSQQVQSALLGRTMLAPPEFLPFCQLVIAFYQDVLALPAEQRINLLRYLYAAAADQDDAAQAK